MKKVFVTRASLPKYDEYCEEIKSIWDTHWLTNMGEKHNEFQKKLKEYLHVDNLELLVNGHMAIEMTIQALGLHGEIITSPFTFASTTHAIVRSGCVPVFCDIDPSTYTIDADKIEELITDKTVAILPIHVYGNICDVDKIDELARKHGLKIIYDAAHAFGESYRKRGIGTYGDVSCFSFHATKVFNSIEGGAATFVDSKIGKEIYKLKNFGIKDEETVDGIGANAKMNEFCAAMGLCNLRHLDEYIVGRKEVYDRYVDNLCEMKSIRINQIADDVESNYGYFPIEFIGGESEAIRNRTQKALSIEGFYARRYFYPITSDFDCYKERFDSKKTPIALSISNRIMTLPLYPDLEVNNVDAICRIIKEQVE